MNGRNLIKMAVAFLLTLLGSPASLHAQLIPPDPYYQLDFWSFQAPAWLSDAGDAPLSFTNLNNPTSFDGNSVQVDTNEVAWLQYAIADSTVTNLTFIEGTIEMWVLPDWNSGTGPGDWGRLIDVGAYSTNAPSSWWSLYFSADGSTLNFSSETNGVFHNYLSVPITWNTNNWVFVCLTYNRGKCEIYTNGELATTGPGVFYKPSAEVVSNGFFVGSDWTGLAQSRVQIDDLATYTYALDAEDITNDYAAGLQAMSSGGFHSAGDPAPPGGGGGTNIYQNTNTYIPNYGTNLWIALPNISSNSFGGFASNTFADVEYEIQSLSNIVDTNWVSQGFFIGSETTNYTPLTALAASKTNNFFIRLRSWIDSDGVGIPDWWQLQYFGYIGIDPYGDPTGDGWNNLQAYENGWNPNVFRTPRPPLGVTVLYNASNAMATITWQPSAGAVTGYSITNLGGSVYTVASNVTRLEISVPTTPNGSFYGDPAIYENYQVQGDYVEGNSQLSAPASLQKPFTASIVYGSAGSAYLVVSSLPANTTAVQMSEYDEYDLYSPTNFNIQVTTNGIYLLPQVVSFADADGENQYVYYGQPVGTNGPVGVSAAFNYNYQSLDDTVSWLAMPWFDARTQLKQNLIFELRAGLVDYPFQFENDVPSIYVPPTPANYACADFFEDSYLATYAEWPLAENLFYQNFIYNITNTDSSGAITTGVESGYGYASGLSIQNPPAYLFADTNTAGGTNPAVLGTNESRWLCSYPVDADLDEIGITYDESTSSYTLASNARNIYGLPFVSAIIASGNTLSSVSILDAGGTTTASGYFYPETAQPQFSTVEYDFWQAFKSWLPGGAGFSTTNTSSMLFTAVGQQNFQVAGYAKMAVTNGYSGVYGYLGQYFDYAYQIDADGVTNTTGILSPYGDFFATQPGPTALLTMPDIDTGARGTGIVNVVSMQLDANHDGTMDLLFLGPDTTSQANPMKFWINDGHCQFPDSDEDEYDQDFPVPPNDPGFENCNSGTITCPRDLENFARLWICGVPVLTNNYHVTLSWANISSGNPAINLYNSVETNGGTGYLTDTNIALEQIQILYTGTSGYSYGPTGGPGYTISRLTNGASFTFPSSYFTNSGNKYFLFEGASVGEGELMMTITDNNSNTVAQTGVWLDLHEIKDFYEQAHITGISNSFPAMRLITNASSFSIDHTPDANPSEAKQIITFVHGWRMSQWDYQDFSDTMFKRLYWAGYQGRFASLRWPTYSADNFALFSQTEATLTYNPSEYIAFRSAQGVSAYFDSLKQRFPDYSLNVAAHSMGNIVMVETLKLQLAANSRDIDNYVLMQAAVPAECYDTNTPEQSSLEAQESDTPTPDTYRAYPGAINYAINGTMTDFYNTNDYALNLWIGNQVLNKPYGSLGYGIFPVLQLYLVPHTLITDPREIMPFGARSRTCAVGAQANVQGVISEAKQINLTAQFGFGGESHDHSGQFSRPIQLTGGFYTTLLNTLFPPE